MKQKMVLMLSFIMTILFAYFIAYIKLKKIGLGVILLDYLFLPISIFLVVDGIMSIIKDDRYFLTRTIRVAIGTNIFIIHLYVLFFV